jgi:hypothetical protein
MKKLRQQNAFGIGRKKGVSCKDGMRNLINVGISVLKL